MRRRSNHNLVLTLYNNSKLMLTSNQFRKKFYALKEIICKINLETVSCNEFMFIYVEILLLSPADSVLREDPWWPHSRSV